MSFDGRAIANYILDYCEANGHQVTNLSLQKIVYFCHVWSLLELGRPLVRHNFEAWQYGPVLQYLYREFNSYDRSAIVGRAKKLDPITGEMRNVEYDFDEKTEELLSRIVRFYSHLSPGQLVELTHVSGGPWDRAWNHGGIVNPGMKIEDDDVVEFYSSVAPPFSIQ